MVNAVTTDVRDPKYIRDTLANRIDHHNDRRTQVFSWASSILVAITGGTITLMNTRQDLSPYQRGLIFGASLIVGVTSCGWIYYHWRMELSIWKSIASYNEGLGVSLSGPKYSLDWWNTAAIVLLVVASLFASLNLWK